MKVEELVEYDSECATNAKYSVAHNVEGYNRLDGVGLSDGNNKTDGSNKL